MKLNKSWEKDGFIIRLAKKDDEEDYYQNLNPLDK